MSAEEREYTISLGRLVITPRYRRAPRAVRMVREFVARHMRVKPEDVSISPELNEVIWSHGIEADFRRLRVKVSRAEGKVTVAPAGP